VSTTVQAKVVLRKKTDTSNKVWLAFIVSDSNSKAFFGSGLVVAHGPYGGTLSVQWLDRSVSSHLLTREIARVATQKIRTGYIAAPMTDIPRYAELLQLISDYGLQPVGFRTALYKRHPTAKLPKSGSTQSTTVAPPVNGAKVNGPLLGKPAGRVGIELDLDDEGLGL